MLLKILFNSITISLPKNIIQFLLGVILFWFVIGVPDTYITLIAMAGFIITYSCVYLFNDIFDYKEDMGDKEKMKWKPIASGHLHIEHAKGLALAFAFVGMVISFFVNEWFFAIMVIMLFLNMLHSSPLTKFKKGLYKTTINMTAIEFLKYSCGWFALTTNISRFPFWLILAFSVVYTTSYIIYKFKFKGKVIKENKKLFWGLGILGVVSYLVSLIQYGFPLTLIFLVLAPLVILIIFKYMNVEVHRISNMIMIEYLLLPLVIICFVILTVPMVGNANDQIADSLTNISDRITDTITENIPDTVMRPIENLSVELERYETLEDIISEVNKTISNITDPII
ncbi:MAG: UbiA prenyltransferase family protein [Candidatus Aenigmarchaeota archaeon]|nr:UbiA prenyltransferase family protein [Candidatus Aenigmarchaeota archaeon]